MADQLDEHARRASSFGSQAEAYDAYRPEYPAALFEWGLSAVRDAPGLRVLDLGAGTGKLTRGLLAAGVDVVAVEPDPAMLGQLARRFPEVETHRAPAEDLPLPDASVNAVFAGQALHWFDLDRALPEIGRVLRPGGSLVAAWNSYDDRVDWVAGFVAVVEPLRRTTENDELDRFPQLHEWGTVEQVELPHQRVYTVDTLVNVTATQSSMLVAAPEEREAVLTRLRDYLAANPVTAPGEFVVPMTTLAFKVTP
jgi:SAM-dependent methyltransferase